MKAGSKEYFMALLSMVLGILILSFITSAKSIGFGKGHFTVASDWVVWLAFGIGFLGLAAPEIMIYFLKGIQFIQHKIGKVFTVVLLSAVFYVFLTPIAFLSKLGKKKPTNPNSALVDRNFIYDKKSLENTF
jgi:hypothetical protein